MVVAPVTIHGVVVTLVIVIVVVAHAQDYAQTREGCKGARFTLEQTDFLAHAGSSKYGYRPLHEVGHQVWSRVC